jgi:hypothetical protein
LSVGGGRVLRDALFLTLLSYVLLGVIADDVGGN